ncbi:MAG: hypothetical protein HOV79_32485 [Hamadaea sp.]|nr:hypothetical protein [Hamadaea sp.]
MTDAPPAAPTVVAEPALDRALVWIGFPLAGALAAWLLQLAADWIAGLAWAPLQGPFTLIASIDEPAATIGSLAVGFVGGAVLAVLAALDRLTATIGPGEVGLVRGSGETTTLERANVEGVFADGKSLVLLGQDGQELAREKSDLKAAALRAAFIAQGYPWLDDDPFKDAYRLWAPGMAGLPEGADALLAARAQARGTHDDTDASTFAKELRRLGVIVRDEKKHQYWRLVTPR